MMTLLAKGLEWLVGSKLIAPLSLVAALTFAHQAWQARDARIEIAAVRRCEAEHELAMAKAERDAARGEAQRMQGEAEAERKVAEDLREERKAIKEEFDAYRDAAASDPRCLSDSVLNLLRGDGKAPAGAGR